MIAYIKGHITFKSPTRIIVETGGVGYELMVSLHTYARIEKLETARILVHEVIREDSHTLYGFATDEERRLFVMLIGVSGVGPATAQLLLSAMTPDEVRAAILGEHDQAFSKVKGIGPKTARRLILELKDKVAKEGGGPTAPPVSAMADNALRQEALAALLALQIPRAQAQKALNKALREKPDVDSVEELIKLALRQLG